MEKNIIHSEDSGLQQLQALPQLCTGREQVSTSVEAAVDLKLSKQSTLNNYNLRITKAGLAIREFRVNQHEVLLHAQE